MPSVSVTLCDVELLGFAVVDGQVQRLDALAALCGRGFVSVGPRSGVRRSVPSVSVAFGDVEVFGL